MCYRGRELPATFSAADAQSFGPGPGRRLSLYLGSGRVGSFYSSPVRIVHKELIQTFLKRNSQRNNLFEIDTSLCISLQFAFCRAVYQYINCHLYCIALMMHLLLH